MATLLRQRYQLGVLQFCPSEATLINNQETQPLTPTEVRLLGVFCEQRGQPLPATVLYSRVWVNETQPQGWRRCFDSVLGRLRRKAANLHVTPFVINEQSGYRLQELPLLIANSDAPRSQPLEIISYEEMLQRGTSAGHLAPRALVLVASSEPLEAQPRYEHFFVKNLTSGAVRYLFLLEPEAFRIAARLVRIAVDRILPRPLTTATLRDALRGLWIVFTRTGNLAPAYIHNAESDDLAVWHVCRTQEQDAVCWQQRSLARPQKLFRLIPTRQYSTVQLATEENSTTLDDFAEALRTECEEATWHADLELVLGSILNPRKSPNSSITRLTRQEEPRLAEAGQ